MDLFDYVREKNMEKEAPLASTASSYDVGRGGGTAAYYRKG